MEHLRNLGVADNTIVVYFSDNGWLWGEHRLRAKNKPYEEAIRAPMFVRYPKLAPLPRTETRFALNIDLAPTFAELAGGRRADRHDGESLLHVLDGTQRRPGAPTSSPRAGPAAIPGPPCARRRRQWKYTEIPVDSRRPEHDLRARALRPGGRPVRGDQRRQRPANAARIAAMAARLRQLRPNWPIDSDPNGPDPDEDDP